MKLIEKDAVVAKIERRIKTNKECMLGLRNLDYYQGKVDALNDTISILDTLEVKEVDLVGHLNGFQNFYAHENGGEFPSAIEIAKHFFELGLLASNPLTWEDMRELHIIFVSLDVDIELSRSKLQKETLGYYEEVLKRFKALKGE